MKSWLIQLGNCVWLSIIFIGAPAISSLRLGSLQITSRPIWHMLAFGGIALGWIGNAIVFRYVARTKQEKRTCLRWLWGYALFGAIFWGYSEKIIQFQWLKDLLLGIERLF